MDLTELLKSGDLFRRFPDDTLAEVINALKERPIKAGELIFSYGDEGNELIIVKEGKIAIFMPIDDEHPAEGQAIRVFEPGQALGEMALIDSKPRSASARAEGDAVILSLTAVAFNHLLTEHPEMNTAIMVGLSDRIRYTTDFLGEVRQWVKKVSDGDFEPQFLNEMKGWVQDVANGEYDEAVEKASDYKKDETLMALAADFAKMASQVKQREDELKKEVAMLKVEIDDSKRKQDVQEIVSSDYYQRIREQAEQMRKLREMEEDEV